MKKRRLWVNWEALVLHHTRNSLHTSLYALRISISFVLARLCFISTTFMAAKPHTKAQLINIEPQKAAVKLRSMITQAGKVLAQALRVFSLRDSSVYLSRIHSQPEAGKGRVNDLDWTLLSNMRLQCTKSFSIPFVISFSLFSALIPALATSKIDSRSLLFLRCKLSRELFTKMCENKKVIVISAF